MSINMKGGYVIKVMYKSGGGPIREIFNKHMLTETQIQLFILLHKLGMR